MRNLIKKILKEQDEFEWIREVSFEAGRYFQDKDICFNDKKTCDVNIDDEYYIFRVDWEDFLSDFLDIGDDDGYYLDSIMYGGHYHYDEGYMDEEEFNYVNPSYTIINRLDELRQKLGLTDPIQNYIDDQNFLDLGQDISSIGLIEITTLFDRLVGDVVNEIEDAVSRNRWTSLQNYYNSLLNDEMEGIGVDKSGDEVEIAIPLEIVHKLMGKGANDLTELLNMACNPLSKHWSEYYYEDWDNDGSHEEVERLFSEFIDESEELIEDTEILENSKILVSVLEEVGAEYSKWPRNQWQIDLDNHQIKITSIDNREGTLIVWKAKGYKQLTKPERISYAELPNYIKNNL